MPPASAHGGARLTTFSAPTLDPVALIRALDLEACAPVVLLDSAGGSSRNSCRVDCGTANISFEVARSSAAGTWLVSSVRRSPSSTIRARSPASSRRLVPGASPVEAMKTPVAPPANSR